MSLDTVPKINWESDDGVIFSDMNNIGNNLQALEDSKHEDGDSPSYVDITATDITTTTQTTTTSNITTLNAGAINPTSITATNVAIADTTAWTPSAGFYIIENIAGVAVQINSGGWKSTDAGSFGTDGSLVRVLNSSGGLVTLDYLKVL